MESTRAGGIVVNSCQLGRWGTQRGGAGDGDSRCTQLWKRHFIFLHLLQLLWQVRLQSTLWHTVERNSCLSGSRWWSAASTWSWSGSFVLRGLKNVYSVFFFFFCSVIWLWLSCKTEGVSGKYWMPANSKFVSLSQLVTITCIHVWENVLFVNVFRASAFVVYQVDRCHFYSSWYLLYFPHQEWPVVAAWEVRNAVKS